MKWFDEQGTLIGTIPRECVEQCSHSGNCEEDVKAWRKKLDFQVPRQKAIAFLREYGAWTIEDLNDKSDEELADIVLWLACGDVLESGEWFGLTH